MRCASRRSRCLPSSLPLPRQASLREDALRSELADMRRRWQDATSRSEGIAAHVHESTAPLLRQIRALQEEGRHRAAAWASAEAALNERLAQVGWPTRNGLPRWFALLCDFSSSSSSFFGGGRGELGHAFLYFLLPLV